MSRRTKIIIGVIVLLLLAMLLALFFLRPKQTPTPTPEPDPVVNQNVGGGGLYVNSNAVGATNLNFSNTNVNAPAQPVEVDDTLGMKNVARTFAELFGSFSTEGNYQNVEDAEYYMADNVKAWAVQYVAEQRAKPPSSEFAGITTRVILDPEVAAYDKEAGTGTVILHQLRRIETGATIADSKTYYQDLTLEMLKVGTDWKISRYTWGPK